MNFLFCQKLRINNLPESIANQYEDMQRDYKRLAHFLVVNSGYGYSERDVDGNLIVHEPGPRNVTPNIAQLIHYIGTENNAENCYGVIYKNYKPNDKARKDCLAAKYLQGLNDKALPKLVETFAHISQQDWEKARQQVIATSFDAVWNNFGENVINPAVRLVMGVRRENKFPAILHPNNRLYCTALFNMIASFFSGWIENSKEHAEKRAALEDKIQANTTPLYLELKNFSIVLSKFDYGLSGRVLKQMIAIRDKQAPLDYFVLPYREFVKFPALMAASSNDLFNALHTVKNYWKLERMQKYICVPNFNKDYQMPFGLTGRGLPFELEVKNNRLTAIVDDQRITCDYSFYFHDLTAEKQDNGYTLKFRNRVKSKNPTQSAVTGPWIEGVVKEIKIQRRDGRFYLYLPFTITHKDENFKARDYFRKAVPDKLETIPDQLIVSAFDMNISTPLTGTKCQLNKNSDNGKLQGMSYGSGNLVINPSIIAHDTTVSRLLVTLCNNMRKLKEIIKDYKIARKKGLSLTNETLDWLKEKSGITSDNNRMHIQIVLKNFLNELKKLKIRCRNNGHNQASENIRLLQTLDMSQSLINSYQNIHVLEQKKTVFFRKANDKRANFREMIGKKYAANIVKFAGDSNVIFIEDIELEFDRDSDMNSMARLFSAGQLKKFIENACNRAGIGCVFVDPALTSRTDPVTGELGFRAKGMEDMRLFGKDLYVERNGQMGTLNSDVAASLNVMLVGLNHSVFPRRFYVEENKLKSDEGKKRITAFAAIRKLKGYFASTENEVVVAKKKPKESLSSYVYVTPNGYITERQKRTKENDLRERIKHLREVKVQIPEFSLTPENITTYKAFQVKKVLDNS